MSSSLILLLIGIVAGISAGLFGIGGGIVLVPALVYFLGFSQHRATGTSLAVLLPPIGIAAVIEYYRNGNVDWKAAIVLALGMIAGSWLGAYGANQLKGPQLRLAFGVFILAMGIYLVHGACRRLGWY